MNDLAHSLTHSLTHSFIHSFTHSLTASSQLLSSVCCRSFVRSFVRLFVRSLSFVRSLLSPLLFPLDPELWGGVWDMAATWFTTTTMNTTTPQRHSEHEPGYDSARRWQRMRGRKLATCGEARKPVQFRTKKVLRVIRDGPQITKILN